MRRLAAVAALVVVAGALAGAGPALAVGSTTGPYCNGVQNGGTFGLIVVAQGAECVLNGVTASNVAAFQNSSLYICDSVINGPVSVNQGYVNIDFDTIIKGSVSVVPPPGAFEEEGVAESPTCGPGSTSCGYSECPEVSTVSGVVCAKQVDGPLSVRQGSFNSLPFMIGGCGYSIFGNNVSILYNNLPVAIYNSKVKGNLSCIGNNPPAQAFNVHVLGQRHGEGCGSEAQPPT